MKNVSKLFGFIALVAIIGFSMTACSGDSSDGNDPFKGTWTGLTGDGEMKLVASGGSFTVSMDGTPAFRGTYTVSGYDVAITFTGINTASGWTAYPENGEVDDLPPKNITGTIAGGQFIISQDDDNMTFTKKGSGSSGGSTPGGGGTPVTPGGGGNGGNSGGNSGGNQTPNSMFVLTGMPYNNQHMYAMFYAEDNYGNPIIGAQVVNVTNTNEGISGTLIEIRDGKVSLPMWVKYEGSFTRYHGNDTVNGSIKIFNYRDVSGVNGASEEKHFSVTFSDGAATKTWSQGQNEPIGGGGAGSGGSGGGESPGKSQP